MRLTWNPASRIIQFRDVLPAVAPRSAFQRELRKFLAGRFDAGLPEHRRLDPERVELACTRRNGGLSIGLRAEREQEDYATRKLMALTHEMFVYLNVKWPGYVYEHFGQGMD